MTQVEIHVPYTLEAYRCPNGHYFAVIAVIEHDEEGEGARFMHQIPQFCYMCGEKVNP